MVHRAWLWIRSRPKRVIAAAVLTALLSWNGLAFLHARAMTRYADGGQRTRQATIANLITGVRVPRPVNRSTPDLPYETHRFGRLEGWRIPRDASRGLVILFHGYGSSKSSLLAPAKVFHESGYETILVDFRGSGGSEGSVTSLGIHEADDVALAVRYATSLSEHQSPILYGISMGSVAILRALHVRAVDAKALILECPFGRLTDTVKRRFAEMGAPSFGSAQLLVFWGGVQLGADGFSHNPVEYARSVRCPVLHLQGASDATITVEQAREIFDNFATARKTLFLAPEVGHEPILKKQPEEWRRVVELFLHETE